MRIGMRETWRTGSAGAIVLGGLLTLISGINGGGDALARASRRAARAELTKIAQDATLAQQAAKAEADGYTEAAKRFYNALNYQEALGMAEKALSADPNHQEAQELARFIRSILGIRSDMVKANLEQFAEQKRVKIQESLMELEWALNRGKKFKDDADRVQPGDEERARDAKLSRKLADLDRAAEQFKRVVEIIKWMPYQVNLDNEEREAKFLLEESRRMHAKLEEGLRVEKRRRAVEQARQQQGREMGFLAERIKKLLAMAKIQYSRLRLEECEEICERILEFDPLNQAAKALLHDAKLRRHQIRDDELYESLSHEWRGTMNNLAESTIPYHRRIRYPSDWDQILRRVETAGRIMIESEPEWARGIRRKLERKVSFEFVDTPLSEAIQFLQTLTKINMILDPSAVEMRGNTPINLKVANMTLNLALDWILRLADLDYALKDSALFISTRERLREDVTLRIYDVRDLTEEVPNYPGPDLQLQSPGAGGGGGGLVVVAAVDEEIMTATTLAEMIRERVRPEEWAAELGTSIEERGGKLVVMQRPEVHRLIDRLLESFRATQKLLITVEGRFLEIREGFFEEIGIDWGNSIDPGSAPYLSGAGFPTPNQFAGGSIASDTMPDLPGIPPPPHDVYPGILPQPGNVDIFGPGVMHVVGAVSNYSNEPGYSVNPNYSPESTTIGRTRASSDMLSQGLNLQFRFMGEIELQAFVHALKVREAYSQLSAPRLTVFNTQRAHMFVATQSSFIADYEVSSNMWDPIIRQFLQGVVFDVKPIVSADRRYITLELRPSTAELINLEEQILSAWMILGTGVTAAPYRFDFPIQFPVIRLRKLRTTVTIPDGGIILLGGMMKNIKWRSETGVPFLSNLPVLGRLFRWDVTDNERTNLSVLVTARLLLFEEEEKKR